MQKNILITGKPKSGKSTLLRKLIATVPDKVGFVTNEILGEYGRVGFEIETYAGHKTILSHVDFKTQSKVSKYFVNVENLESVLPEISDTEDGDILYLDEIGEMQLFSDDFRKLVLKYLNSENICLATLSYVFENEFTNSIKKRDDIILVEISSENREEKGKFISELLKKIEKARKYISEPERFIVQDSYVELRSEHGIRKLVFINGKWDCSCDFSKKYNICSHAIAAKEIIKIKHL